MFCVIWREQLRGTNIPHEKGTGEIFVTFLPCQELMTVIPVLEWEPLLKFNGAPQLSRASTESTILQKLYSQNARKDPTNPIVSDLKGYGLTK